MHSLSPVGSAGLRGVSTAPAFLPQDWPLYSKTHRVGAHCFIRSSPPHFVIPRWCRKSESGGEVSVEATVQTTRGTASGSLLGDVEPAPARVTHLADCQVVSHSDCGEQKRCKALRRRPRRAVWVLRTRVSVQVRARRRQRRILQVEKGEIRRKRESTLARLTLAPVQCARRPTAPNASILVTAPALPVAQDYPLSCYGLHELCC